MAREQSAAAKRAVGLKTKPAETGELEASVFLSAVVSGSAVMSSSIDDFPAFNLHDADGNVVNSLDPFVVLLDCRLKTAIEFDGEMVTEVPAWFNVNGNIIAGGENCDWNGEQNADRSLSFLGKIGFDFDDAEAVIDQPVRVKLGRNNKNEIVADVCTHPGRGHDEASMSAGAAASAHMANMNTSDEAPF